MRGVRAPNMRAAYARGYASLQYLRPIRVLILVGRVTWISIAAFQRRGESL